MEVQGSADARFGPVRQCFAEVARGMYDETGADDRHKYTVAEIAETFGVDPGG